MNGASTGFRRTADSLVSHLQLVQLRPQFFQRGGEVRQSLLFLCDHICRRAFDEARVAELGLRLGDLAFQSHDFLAYAFALGRHVDLDFQHQARRANHRYRRVGFGQRTDDARFGETREQLHVREKDEVELSGVAFGQRYRVRFVGSFADDTACIRVTVDGEGIEPLCPRPIATSLAGDQPSLHVVNTADLAVVVGSVPPDVVEIRFTSDSGNITQSQSHCQIGPAGWTDPDRRVCAMALPAQDGGTFEYLDSDGDVLFEDGMAWFVSQGEPVAPMPVDPVHGGTYWAVYPWVGAPGDREADDVSAWLLQEFGIESFAGDLACDEGAAEALGTDAEQGIGVYFETQDEANAFASQAGLLGDEADPVIARVTTYCLD